ncbi:hypothetical protein EMCRGX_G019817 [Ephydatia muelleri]
METRIAFASVLSVAILQMRFASGVPTERPSRAASDGMGYNELVASLSAGSAAVLYWMVRASIIIYSSKINAFDEIHLKAQQSLSILPSPSDTTQQDSDTFWKQLQALTHLSGEFAQLEDLVANGNDVNDSDIMVTYELMKPLKRNLCSYATTVLGPSFNCSRKELQNLQRKLDLYDALQAVSLKVLDYATTLDLTKAPSQNEWIGINIVCQRTVSRNVMLILQNVFGTFQQCAI